MKSALALLLLALCCACSRTRPITVASKNFTEQIILGEIAAQQIERKLHVTVARKLNLGGTLLTQEAIVRGDIDVYPEYTGTGASVVLKQKAPVDANQAYRMVRDEYLRRFHLLWLRPLGFNDTFAMAVRAEDGKRLKAPELSAASERAWRLGVGYEFLTRPDGLARLDQVYKLHWQGMPKSMDLGLLYRGLQQKQVDMVAGNSTDAQLSDPAIMTLQDDKHAFPAYEACFVMRQALAEEKPEVKAALEQLSGRITDKTMREMNRRVEVQHAAVAQVAADFLKDQQ